MNKYPKSGEIINVKGDRGVGDYKAKIIKRCPDIEKHTLKLTGVEEVVYKCCDPENSSQTFYITNYIHNGNLAKQYFEIDPFL